MILRILTLAVLAALPQLTAASLEWPNEPAGATLISDDPLTVMNANGWTCYCNTSPQPGSSGSEMFMDPTAPFSGPMVFRERFAVGHPGGISAGNYYHALPPNLSEIYVGFWWKASPGFESNLAGTKLGFIKGSGLTRSDGSTYGGMHTVPHMQPGNTVFTPWSASFYMPASADINNCGVNVAHYGDCPGTQHFFGTNATIIQNTWYRWEIYQKRSTTVTSADGILRLWITQQGGAPIRVVNATNVNGPIVGWEQYEINPTWGGNGGAYGDGGATTDGFFSYDHVHISAPHGASGMVEREESAIGGSRMTVESRNGNVVFRVQQNGAYSLRAYDLSGRMVCAYKGQGQNEIKTALRNGIYFAKLMHSGHANTIRFSVLR